MGDARAIAGMGKPARWVCNDRAGNGRRTKSGKRGRPVSFSQYLPVDNPRPPLKKKLLNNRFASGAARWRYCNACGTGASRPKEYEAASCASPWVGKQPDSSSGIWTYRQRGGVFTAGILSFSLMIRTMFCHGLRHRQADFRPWEVCHEYVIYWPVRPAGEKGTRCYHGRLEINIVPGILHIGFKTEGTGLQAGLITAAIVCLRPER